MGKGIIIQEFKGEIRGVNVDNEAVFYSADYCLDLYRDIEDNPSKEFVKKFTEMLRGLYFDSDYFSFYEFESQWERDIEDALLGSKKKEDAKKTLLAKYGLG